MSIFLDTPETCQRFGNCISEFRLLLDANHIHHGLPGDIFEFAGALESNNQFRLDLSAMVKSVVQKESEEILLTDMMSIIVTSVGGTSFSDTHSGITEQTKTLMEFLLGTGCWKQFGSYSSPLSQNPKHPLTPPVRTQESHSTPLSAPTSGAPTASAATSEDTENLGGLLDASGELREMLTQLETNAEQIKRHLDSIEQQINKIEPPPDISSPPAPLPHPSSTDADIEMPVFKFKVVSPSRGRAVFFDEPQQSQANDFQSPTFAYATEKRRSIIPIGVFLALLAIIAVCLFFVHSGRSQVLLQAGMSRFKTVRALFSSPPAAVAPAPTAGVPSEPVSTSASIAAAPAPPSPETPPPAPAKGVIETTPAHSASHGADPAVSPDIRSTPVQSKIRYIPANVMEGYLLSAPRPQYPTLARRDHIQGSVALQATISKSGSIETLHVIKGPQPLLGAALDAVRNWQYRPFSLDGRPTEVTTTVYVDFTLKPPPATAN